MSAKIYAGVIASFSLLFAPASWAAIKEYHLNIHQGMVNITGKSVKRMTVNGKFITDFDLTHAEARADEQANF